MIRKVVYLLDYFYFHIGIAGGLVATVLTPGHILPTVLGWMFLGWVVFGGIVVMLRNRYMPTFHDPLKEGRAVGHPMKYESIPTYYELQEKYEQSSEEQKLFLRARLEQMKQKGR